MHKAEVTYMYQSAFGFFGCGKGGEDGLGVGSLLFMRFFFSFSFLHVLCLSATLLGLTMTDFMRFPFLLPGQKLKLTCK